MISPAKSYCHRGGETPLLGETIPEHFAHIVKQFPAQEAVVSMHQQRRMSYAEMARSIDELAYALQRSEVQGIFTIPSFRSSDYVAMLTELLPELKHSGPTELNSKALPFLQKVVIYDPEKVTETERPHSGFMLWQEVLQAGEDIEEGALDQITDDLGSMDEEIFSNGIRNSHLMAIAPSLFANNISSGIEPVFDFQYQRRVRGADGTYSAHMVSDYAWRLWQKQTDNEKLPDYFVEALLLSPEDHLAMQAALQPYVDSAISKTINIPADYDFAAFKSLYYLAYQLGLKGCTTFRPNEITGAILSVEGDESGMEPQTQCCSLERESS